MNKKGLPETDPRRNKNTVFLPQTLCKRWIYCKYNLQQTKDKQPNIYSRNPRGRIQKKDK